MTTLDQLLFGIRQVESGGEKDPYHTVNSIGAVGAYQVMKGNVAEWTQQALGHAMTWQAFRDSPAAQDAVARYKLNSYMQGNHGSVEAAAAMWFSGQPNPNSKASDGGNTVRSYVDKVLKAMGQAPTSGSVGSGGAVGGPLSGRGSALPTVGHGVYTTQQAGYSAATRTNSFGAPVNPFKVPGWIASQNTSGSGGTAGTGAVQAGVLDDLTGGGVSIPWDGVSTVVLSTLFLLGGLGLVVVGLISATGAQDKVKKAAMAATPVGAAAGAVKGAS